MSEIIKIQKELFFKSVTRSKKGIILCTDPNVSKADVDRVAKIRANKGNNKGDKTLMFGKKKAQGYSALPSFGVNYFLGLDVSDHTAKELPSVGDAFTLDVFVEQKEDGTEVPAKPVVSTRTKQVLSNTYWAYLPA